MNWTIVFVIAVFTTIEYIQYRKRKKISEEINKTISELQEAVNEFFENHNSNMKKIERDLQKIQDELCKGM